MKYKYRVFYEIEPESKRPPEGWYCIYRKPAGFWGLIDSWWSFVCLGATLERAYDALDKKMKDSKPQKILIKEWVEE